MFRNRGACGVCENRTVKCAKKPVIRVQENKKIMGGYLAIIIDKVNATDKDNKEDNS